MKIRKKIYALLITLALAATLLPAAYLGESAPQGTYIEIPVAVPEGYTALTSIAVKPDGSLAAAAQQGDTGAWVLLHWTDIGTPPEVMSLAYTGGSISQIDFAPDGSLLVIANDMMMPAEPPEGQGSGPQVQGSGPKAEGNGTQAQGGVQMQGGKAVIRSLDDISNTATWFNADGTSGGSLKIKGLVTQVTALNNKQAAVLERRNGITIYDEKGNSISQIAATDINSIAISGEVLVALSKDKLTQYDVKSGEKLNTVDISTDSSARVAIGPDSTAYIMDSTGLYAVKPTDSQQTKLMDALGTLIGDPSNGMTGMTVMKDGTVVMLVMQSSGSIGSEKSVQIGGGHGIKHACRIPLYCRFQFRRKAGFHHHITV